MRLFQPRLQGILVRHEKSDGIRVLTIVQHDLVYVFRIFDQGLLNTFRTVFLPVRTYQKGFETAYHVKEILVPHISHVSRVQPSVHNGFRRGFRILPVTGHYVFALYDDFPFLSVRQFIAVVIADFYVHRLDHAARRPENVFCRCIGRDDRSCLRETVALIHRNAYRIVIPLKIDVEQCPSTDEEFHLASESLAHLFENQFVEQGHKRFFPALFETALVVTLLVVGNCKVQGIIVKFLHFRAFGLDSGLDILLEILGKGRDTQHYSRLQFLDTHRNIAQSLHWGLAGRHSTDRRPVRHESVESGHMGETMVKRQDDKHPVFRSHAYDGTGLLHVGRIVPVSQQDTLWIGSRSRGVTDVGIVIRKNRLVPLLEFIPVFCKELVTHGGNFRNRDFLFPIFRKLVEDYDLFHQRQVREDVPYLRQLPRRNHNILGIRMFDSEYQVVAFFQFYR